MKPPITVPNTELSAVVEATAAVAGKFDRAYWRSHCEAGAFPTELWHTLADADLLGLGVAENYGGAGGGVSEAAALIETLTRHGLPVFTYLTTYICREVIAKHGSDEQRRRFLPASVQGDCVFSFAITEPDAGTNTFAIRTKAARTGDGWLLNGEKVFISGVDHAHAIVVVARDGDGFSLLLVDPQATGLSYTPMSIRMPSPDRQFTVHFDDVHVGAEDVIGPPGEAFRALFTVLNPERLLTAAAQTGLGYFALERGVNYARERAPFGVPIGSYQAVQHPLAHARAQLDAARLLTYYGCQRYDDAESAGEEANTAKLLASEASLAAFDAAMQAHGGAAFDEDVELATMWPLARIARIGPVNNEAILNYIGEHVLGLPKSY